MCVFVLRLLFSIAVVYSCIRGICLFTIVFHQNHPEVLFSVADYLHYNDYKTLTAVVVTVCDHDSIPLLSPERPNISFSMKYLFGRPIIASDIRIEVWSFL